MFDEIIVLENEDKEKFENDVNGWCCNCSYRVMSCQCVQKLDKILYVAFLGKSYRE